MAKVEWDNISGVASIKYEDTLIYVVTKDSLISDAKDKVIKFNEKIRGANVNEVKIPKELNFKPKLVLANGQLGTPKKSHQSNHE